MAMKSLYKAGNNSVLSDEESLQFSGAKHAVKTWFVTKSDQTGFPFGRG